MMRRVEVTATVGHPVERVFAHLADPLLWHRFVPAVAFRRQIDDRPATVGSRWMATDRIGPFRFHFIDELAAFDRNRRAVWLSSSPWNARVEYLCTADGDRTRIRATYEGDVVGSLLLLVGWLPDWIVRRILSQDFRRLDRLLAREAQSARRWQLRHPSTALDDDDGPAPMAAVRATRGRQS